MFFHSTNLQISLAMMLRFQDRLKLVNREIETVVLNTLKPYWLKEVGDSWIFDFSRNGEPPRGI